MTVKVLCFAALQEETGFREREMELGKDATAGAVWQRLKDEFETLAKLPMPLVAVNESYAPADQVLNDGDEVALIPPVSGG